jgi:hypothetical protein
MALQYGMSWEEFWHKDKRLFEVYQKSYYKDIYEKAWLNGMYQHIALQVNLGNMFAKKGVKPLEYPHEPFDPFKQKKVITSENLEIEYRDLQKNQNDFIRSLLKNKK